ncbi:Coenzyme F420 hydrogenase/dehydrogenase, beta subunit C-terminal domain [Thermaurantiacus sp.]
MTDHHALPPSLARVVRGNSCSGCGLCAGVAPGIAMERDAKGWWRPKAVGPVPAETDALFAHICPGATVAPWQPAGGEATLHPYWGPIRDCLTGFATDPELRFAASSGGALSALALHALSTGLVSRVLHVGMDPEAPLLTTIRRSTGRADVLASAGSRYAPAAPLAELMAELETPGRILFIGKPCDVGALRQLMAADPAVAARFPLLLSFFCAATPSQAGTDRIVAKLGVAGDELASFRYRGNGWPGRAEAITRDGRRASMSYADSWGAILSKEVQWRCKICPDAVGGVADIAAADAWHADPAGYPLLEEADGRSLILTRTVAGAEALARAVADGVLEVTPVPVAEIDSMQPSQARRKRLVKSRVLAMALAGLPRPKMAGLLVRESARRASLREALRSLAGSWLRIRQRRW